MIRRLLLTALAASAVAAPALAASDPVFGVWLTQTKDGHVRIGPCASDPAQVCGTIVWARGPNGEALRPDAATKGDKFYVELKPDTPSGRKAGAAQAARYRRLTKTPTRPTYYNPDDYR